MCRWAVRTMPTMPVGVAVVRAVSFFSPRPNSIDGDAAAGDCVRSTAPRAW